MFVVPFVLRDSPASLIQWKLRPIVIFLENHGKHLCSTDSPEEWLRENGFVVKRAWREKDNYFAEIDSEKTALRDFYSFEQLTKEQKKGTEECWRTFFWLESPTDEMGSEKTWNGTLEEPFYKVLESIYSFTSKV